MRTGRGVSLAMILMFFLGGLISVESLGFRTPGEAGSSRSPVSRVRKPLIPHYVGPPDLVEMLESERSVPLALAASDFDADGVADLLVGYAHPEGGGVLAVHETGAEPVNPDRHRSSWPGSTDQDSVILGQAV